MASPKLSAEALEKSNGSTDAAARARSSTMVDAIVQPMETLPCPFGKYELRSLLGRGGMGAVYLAYDPSLDRLVALKIPRPLAEEFSSWRERFLAEARAAAVIHHPNICPVHDVGEIGDQPYLTMPYLEGETLAARLKHLG